MHRATINFEGEVEGEGGEREGAQTKLKRARFAREGSVAQQQREGAGAAISQLKRCGASLVACGVPRVEDTGVGAGARK